MGFLQNLTKPSISPEVPDQPMPGGTVTEYVVAGMWGEDGNVIVPERIIIQTDSGQSCEKPGDTMKLTRLEASVLGKTVVLTPIVGGNA